MSDETRGHPVAEILAEVAALSSNGFNATRQEIVIGAMIIAELRGVREQLGAVEAGLDRIYEGMPSR